MWQSFVYELDLLIPKVNLLLLPSKRENAARREVLMYLLLRNETGRMVGGLLLAAGRNKMRVAIPGEADTLEMALFEGAWHATGERFELEALVAGAEGAMSTLGEAFRAKTLTAGTRSAS